MSSRCVTSQSRAQQMLSKLTTPSFARGLERLTLYPKHLSFISHCGWRLDRRKRSGGSERLSGVLPGGGAGTSRVWLFFLLFSPNSQPGECLPGEDLAHPCLLLSRHRHTVRCDVDGLSPSPSPSIDFVFFLNYSLLVRFVSP